MLIEQNDKMIKKIKLKQLSAMTHVHQVHAIVFQNSPSSTSSASTASPTSTKNIQSNTRESHSDSDSPQQSGVVPWVAEMTLTTCSVLNTQKM